MTAVQRQPTHDESSDESSDEPRPIEADDFVLDDLAMMMKAKNYRRWLYDQVKPFVGRRIVEFGCGVGNYIEFLADAERIVAVDVHAPALAMLRQRFPDDRRISTIRLEVGVDDITPLVRERCDTVLCFNVMEHIRDHEGVVEALWRALEPGGRLCLIVPAAPAAYGTLDAALLHVRRYRKREVIDLVEGAGFVVEDAYHLNFVGLFGWWLNNRVLKRHRESPAQIGVFDRWVVPWLRQVEAVVRPPFGLSIVCIARKP